MSSPTGQENDFEEQLFHYYMTAQDKVLRSKIKNVSGMAGNCLPISLAMLPLVQQQYPDAEIHIGAAAKVDEATIESWHGKLKADLDAFVAGNGRIVNYHSWIEMTISGERVRLDLTFAASNPRGVPEGLIANGLRMRAGINYVTVYTGANMAETFLERVWKAH